MALVDVKPRVYFPDMSGPMSQLSPAITDEILNADTEATYLIFTAPDTATIDHVGFYLRTVDSNPSVSLDVGIYEVNNDGTIGSLVTSSSLSAETVTTTTDDRWHETSATDMNAAVTAGEKYAIGWTLNGTGDVDIARMSAWRGHSAFMIDVSGSRQSRSVPVTIRYDDDTYGDLQQIGVTNNTVAEIAQFDSNSSEPYRGAVFKVPFKCRVTALTAYLDQVGSQAASYQFHVYKDSSLTTTPTLEETGPTMYAEQHGGSSIDFVRHILDTKITCDAGDYLHVIIESTHATNVIGIQRLNYDSSTERERYMGDYQCAESTNGTTFTHLNDEVYYGMGVIIDQLDDGAGGGGSGGGMKLAGGGGLAA